MSLVGELKRRNVFRVAAAYAVLSWLLLQVADTLGDTLALPEWTGKMVLLLLVIGFIPAVIFSWVYELTPEGVKKESEIDRSESITAHTGRKLDIAVMVMLVGVVALYLLDPRESGQSTDRPGSPQSADSKPVASAEEIESIAVLPFEDFSAEGDQGHLARGIADTVLHMLAQASNLKVAARTSSFAYEGTNTPIAQIATDLGVGAVLEGSVQRAGDQLRIIAQLIRASDQSHLWSETFDRSAADIFAIQDEIAQAVVVALRPEAAPEEGAPASERTDLAAYDHFLMGKEALEQGTSESVEKALVEFQAALAIDPDYVPALVQLGVTYMNLNAVTPKTWAEIEGPAEAAFRKAVELAPDDADAQAGMGRFILQSGYDSLSARPYFEKAQALNPNNPSVLSGLANFHVRDGEIDKAGELRRRAYELDPNNRRYAEFYAGHLNALRKDDQARAIAQRFLSKRPDEPVGHQILLDLAWSRGRLDEAVPIAIELQRMDPNSYGRYFALANLYAQLGDFETARDWYDRTPEAHRTEDYLPWSLFMTDEGLPRLKAWGERNIALYPGWDGGQQMYVAILFMNRELEEGVEAAQTYEEALQNDRVGDDAAIAGILARRVGETEFGDRLIEHARSRFELYEGKGIWPFELADAGSLLALADGDHDRAFAFMEQAFEAGFVGRQYYRLNPAWDPLREDPRFRDLLARIDARLAEQRERLREQGL